MSSFYDNIDSNDTESNKEYSRVYAPQFTRTRQIYKGPRDSEKVNLEINQILFDINQINEAIEAIKSAQESVMDGFENGHNPFITGDEPSVYPEIDVPGQTFNYYLDDTKTPDYIAIEGGAYILLSVEQLQTRIAVLLEFLNIFISGEYTNG